MFQVQREAIGRDDVEAHAREQHDVAGLRLSVGAAHKRPVGGLRKAAVTPRTSRSRSRRAPGDLGLRLLAGAVGAPF